MPFFKSKKTPQNLNLQNVESKRTEKIKFLPKEKMQRDSKSCYELIKKFQFNPNLRYLQI